MQGTTTLIVRAAVVAIVAVALSSPTQTEAASPTPPAASAGVTPVSLVSPDAATDPADAAGRVFNASPAERELVAWARGRFDRAGLAFPTVDVVFHPRREDCGGLAGYAASAGDRPTEIHLCTEREPGNLVSRRVLLHELAHAWAAATLDSQTREAFVALRRLPSWDAPDTPWERRGTEQAAEILTWALLEEEIPVVAIPDAAPGRLATGYQMLTGHPAPPRP